MSSQKLTDKQQNFINEYLRCWNATEAARRAGYRGDDASLAVIGHENLRKVKIADEIAQRVSENAMGANESLAAMSEMARLDIGNFLRVQGGIPFVDFEKAKAEGKLGLVKKITYGKGTISFELYDRQRAIETMMKHNGLLKSDVNINVNIQLIEQTVKALTDAGLDPAIVFQDLINEVARVRQQSDSEAGH